jgi:diguanylate cyclase (GGDEF)-like protein/PAS domain S-box-containing protein
MLISDLPHEMRMALASVAARARAPKSVRVLAEQIRIVHEYARLSQLIALTNAGILAYVVWPVVEYGAIASWLACMTVVSLLRLAQSTAFARTRPEGDALASWRNRFLLGAAASGTLWGAAAFALFPEQSIAHQVFLTFVIAGMIAGSVATLSPLLPAFVLFAVPAFGPVVVQFALGEGEIYLAMALMTLLFGVAMLAVAKHMNATIVTSLGLSDRNSELVDVLTQANARAEALNLTLQNEVADRRQTEHALRQSEATLAEAQHMAHLGSWSYETATHRADWSEETFRLYGLDPSSRVPSCWQLLSRIHTEDRRRMHGLLKRAITAGEGYQTEFRVVTPGHRTRWVHALGQAITDASGRVAFVRGTVLDITERKTQEQLLEGERRVLQAIATGAPLAEVLELLCRLVEEQCPSGACSIMLIDAETGRLRLGAAPSLPADFARTMDGVQIGMRMGSCAAAARCNERVISPDIEADPRWEDCRDLALGFGLRACWSFPVAGAERPVTGTFAVYFGRATEPTLADSSLMGRATSIARIAIERHESEQRIRHLAHYDGLTGLPNRATFSQAVELALRRAERAGRLLGLLFVDVDRFKNINDTLGHDAGDMLLKQVAERLSGCLRGGDLVARFGGDEFVVALEEVSVPEVAATVAEKILDALTPALRIDGQDFHVSASIGIALYPTDGADLQTLQKHADIAMYRAKEQGRNSYRYYSPHSNTHSLERLTLEAQLRRALEREELALHYQPKQEIRSGRVVGMEALLRWRHPELGMIPPARFIPLAEETGLIVPIGAWVLRQACNDMQRMRANYTRDNLRVAVNLSARQFADAGLMRLLQDALEASALPPSNLELEITESLVMHNPDQAARLLAEFKEMGIHVAMDDFGTGYSSLASLKRFPIDSIKIDRSFIQGLPRDPDDATITEAIIAMAHSLRLSTIAEGVETGQQFEFLRERRCDEIQGNYFSRPLAFEDLVRTMGAATGADGASPTAVKKVAFWP